MKYLSLKMIVLSFFFSTLSFAQTDEGLDYGNATISEDYCVTIDTDQPIKEFYEIDIAHLHLATEKDADDKFGFIENNLLSYIVDFSESKAYLQIHLDRTVDSEDVVWWNDYIGTLCGL